MCFVMGRQGKKQAIVQKNRKIIKKENTSMYTISIYMYTYMWEYTYVCKYYQVFFITLFSKRHYLVEDNKQLLNSGI